MPTNCIKSHYTPPKIYSQLINIHNVLDSLLSFISIHFSQHLNQDQNIPEKGRVEVYSKFQKLNNTFKKQLQGIDESLYDLIVITFELKTCKTLNYNDLYYLELLSTTITNFRPSAKDHNPTESFIEQLYYINFNSWRFFDYLAQNIHHQITLNTNIETKIKTLALELKKVRQYKTRKDIKYNPFQKSAGKFISQWISEEISCLERQKHNSAYISLPERNADTVKIQFDLSVPQVACLFKIMHDVKLITNPNITQLTEVIAHNITTKKTESVSPGSLRGKFIAVEEPALDTIKSLLIQMINQITKIQTVLLFFFLDDLVSVYQQVGSLIDF